MGEDVEGSFMEGARFLERSVDSAGCSGTSCFPGALRASY